MARPDRLALAGLALAAGVLAYQSPANSSAPPGMLQAADADTLILRKAASLAVRREGAPAELKQLLSTDGTAPHLAQDPSFTQLLSLATSNRILGSSGSVFTIGLTPFLAYSLAQPSVLTSNERYNAPANVWMRRLGGSISFGGKGEIAAKDSAGKSMPIPLAEDLRDIVNWELRLRVFGSRDRRELGPERRLMRIDASRLQSRSLARQEVYDTLLARAGFDTLGATYLRRDAARAVVNDSALAPLLMKVADVEAGLAREIRRARSDIDGGLIVTLTAGATNQRAVFGPKRMKAGISAAKGIAISQGVVWDATVSGVARRTQGRNGESDTTSTEVAVKLAHAILKGWLGFSVGLPISLEYFAKLTDPTPSGGHGVVHSSLVALELPVSDTAKATVSLGWSNHADALGKSDQLFGHFGLSYDFSGLFKSEGNKPSK